MTRPTKSRWPLIAGCLAFTLAAAAFVKIPPGTDSNLDRAIGSQLALQASALGNPGGHVVVITRDTDTFPQPAMDVLLAEFKSQLDAKLTIFEVKTIQADPLRPLEVPPGDFFEAIRKGKPGDVIVSFLGPPFLLEEHLKKLGPVKPKIVAFCPGEVADTATLQVLAAGGLLHAAILSKPAKPGDATRNPSKFEELYQSFTAADLAKSKLPSP